VKKIVFLAGLASALLLTPSHSAQAQTTKTGTASISYSPDCITTETLNPLGTLSVTVQDNATPLMSATFTVDPAARASGIFSCMRLHFIQMITQDDAPALYLGNRLPRAGHAVIDPPFNGWDYQRNPKYDYKNGAPGDDQLPWYWNAGEESTPKGNPRSQPGVSYRMDDTPGYPGKKMDGSYGTTSFTTFIAAESLYTCGDPSCLVPGREILLLAGVDWVVQNGSSTLGAVRAPTANDVATFNDALSEAGFGNWTTVRDKEICCPEPGVCVLLLSGLPVGAMWLRRRVRRGACAA
jgi:hypothetical protein